MTRAIRSRRGPAGWTALCLAVTACQLTEVTLEPGQRQVAVQGVINRSQAEQFVLLEYTIVGDSNASSGGRIPPGRPTLAIGGALVTIEQLGPGPCTGRIDTLIERFNQSGATTGRYSRALCGTDPGTRLKLTVNTPDGHTVTGETTIPGATSRTISAGGLAPGGTAVFNRDRDTLNLAVTAASGRALQIELRREENHEDVGFYFFADSLGMRLPGNLVNPFEGDSGEHAFIAGRYHILAVALLDRNYYDWARSFSDPITGRGFLNRLVGGVGVFGSVEVATYQLRVTANAADPRDGVYQITGRSGTVDVNLTLDLWVDPLDGRRFSTFVSGTSTGGPTNTSASGSFAVPVRFTTQENDPNAFAFAYEVRQTAQPTFRRYTVRALRTTDGSPFPVEYIVTDAQDVVRNRNTLSARQLSGPR